MPIVDIQGFLGHTDPRTTVGTYAMESHKPAIIGTGKRLQAMSADLKKMSGD